jgi:hypothetical protein
MFAEEEESKRSNLKMKNNFFEARFCFRSLLLMKVRHKDGACAL